MRKVAIIIGARPQFIKHAALEVEFKDYFEAITIHTGQHYDQKMSDIFFNELKINQPTYMLNIGSGLHGEQTASMMISIEKILMKEKVNCVVVYGDTNSTLAGALAAAKLNIPIAHVEAGLRSYNKFMPEEINRVLTDHVSSLLFCPTDQAVKNLETEGITDHVFNVGDVMVDMIRIASEKGILKTTPDHQEYYFSTIHRPYNTDNIDRLVEIIKILNSLDKKVKFAVHPRTLNKLKDFNVDVLSYKNIQYLEPVSYFESLQLQYNAKAVITDSGGIQKEAYILRKKCVTIRSETEWTETLKGNWNSLLFNDLSLLQTHLNTPTNVYYNDAFGDGYAAMKIVNRIKNGI